MTPHAIVVHAIHKNTQPEQSKDATNGANLALLRTEQCSLLGPEHFGHRSPSPEQEDAKCELSRTLLGSEHAGQYVLGVLRPVLVDGLRLVWSSDVPSCMD